MGDNNDIQLTEAAAVHITDLPDEILRHIISSGLKKPRELPSLALTSKRFHRLTKTSPFTIAIPTSFSTDRLARLSETYPGITELDLRDHSLDDTDIQLLLTRLPSLTVLGLSGCKKLTPKVVEALKPIGSSINAVFIQRAFQLGGESLESFLQWASSSSLSTLCDGDVEKSSNCQLRALAMSHLHLASFAPNLHTTTATSLKHLALHNCVKVSPVALQSIAIACPSLQTLCLGGCDLLCIEEQALVNSSNLTILARIEEYSTLSTVAAARKRAEGALVTALNCVTTHSCQKPNPGGRLDAWVSSLALELGTIVFMLPELEVLEVTFCAPGLAALLSRMVSTCARLSDSGISRSCNKRERAKNELQIWDMCTLGTARKAAIWRKQKQQSSIAHALVAAVARCSAPNRVSPLHVAAEDGDTALAAAVLRLGAGVNARDRRCASPLFAACEAGHASVVRLLLLAGADVTLKNAAGEAPLYIAALRGHLAATEVLLDHCAACGLDWTRFPYGDGWTPLHAAAVGGRGAVVTRLLKAAGKAAPGLILAVNRYGQTPLHVAARKGSPTLLQELMDAGGEAALKVLDSEGRSAAQVARNNGNASGWKLLLGASGNARQEAARMKAQTPTVEKKPRESQGGQARWVGRRLQSRKSHATGNGGGG